MLSLQGLHGAQGGRGARAVNLRRISPHRWPMVNPHPGQFYYTEGQSLRASCPRRKARDGRAARRAMVPVCCTVWAGERLWRGQRPPERVAGWKKAGCLQAPERSAAVVGGGGCGRNVAPLEVKPYALRKRPSGSRELSMNTSKFLAVRQSFLGALSQLLNSTSVICTSVSERRGPTQLGAGWPILPHQVHPWTRISFVSDPHIGTSGKSGST